MPNDLWMEKLLTGMEPDQANLTNSQRLLFIDVPALKLNGRLEARVRQSTSAADNFSAMLLYIDSLGNTYTVVRCDGPKRHTNKIGLAGMDGRTRLIPSNGTPHVHYLTAEQMRTAKGRRSDPESFAMPHQIYSDLRSATYVLSRRAKIRANRPSLLAPTLRKKPLP